MKTNHLFYLKDFFANLLGTSLVGEESSSETYRARAQGPNWLYTLYQIVLTPLVLGFLPVVLVFIFMSLGSLISGILQLNILGVLMGGGFVWLTYHMAKFLLSIADSTAYHRTVLVDRSDGIRLEKRGTFLWFSKTIKIRPPQLESITFTFNPRTNYRVIELTFLRTSDEGEQGEITENLHFDDFSSPEEARELCRTIASVLAWDGYELLRRDDHGESRRILPDDVGDDVNSITGDSKEAENDSTNDGFTERKAPDKFDAFDPENLRLPSRFFESYEIEWEPDKRLFTSLPTVSWLSKAFWFLVGSSTGAFVALVIVGTMKTYGGLTGAANIKPASRLIGFSAFVVLSGLSAVWLRCKLSSNQACEINFQTGRITFPNENKNIPTGIVSEVTVRGYRLENPSMTAGPTNPMVYSCKLFLQTSEGEFKILENAQQEGGQHVPYRQLMPLAVELAEKLEVPHNWVGFSRHTLKWFGLQDSQRKEHF